MERITDTGISPFEEEHLQRMRELAAECAVLLKKDGKLPLSAPGKIGLYGSGARHTIKGGTGSGDVNVRHFTTVEEGLVAAGFEIVSGTWLDAYDAVLAQARDKFVAKIKAEAAASGVNVMMYSMGKSMPEPEYNIPLDVVADTAIYILSRNSGEGADRADVPGDIRLTQTELRDIRWLSTHYDRFVLVLNTGGFIDLTPVLDCGNILQLSQLGSVTGFVLADLLLGIRTPSGKLTMTWAPLASYPSTEGFGDPDDTRYREGIYVGYRYFDSFDVPVLFPFGYGLSYTRFDWNLCKISVSESTVHVDAAVTNTGIYPGKEVLQLYLTLLNAEMDVPVKVLAAFGKTGLLLPGELGYVSLGFSMEDMAVYDTNNAQWALPSGDYLLRLGTSSQETEEIGILHLEHEIITHKVANRCGQPDFTDLRRPAGKETAHRENLPIIHVDFECGIGQTYRASVSGDSLGERIPWQSAVSGEHSLEDFLAGLSNEELARLSTGYFDEDGGMGSIIGSSAVSVAGAAGETSHALAELGLPAVVMADGPAGLRLCTRYKLAGNRVIGMDNPLEGMMAFLDEETLSQIAAMTPPPSEEELNAPVHYVYCSAIPIGTAVAQSFNPAVAEAFGDIVGDEMERFGVHLWLSPAMNIQRNPLCGRNFEYFSEDPVVSAEIASGITKGVQAHRGCGVTVKHFACNNQETNRLLSNSMVSERALREIYLKGFRLCLDRSKPLSVMSSYNLINGVHTCNSFDLLTGILREEWGYDGVVMTDWYAADSVMSGTGRHAPGTAAGCILAGNDLAMPGMKEDVMTLTELAEGNTGSVSITRSDLMKTAKRVLKLIARLTSEGVCDVYER